MFFAPGYSDLGCDFLTVSGFFSIQIMRQTWGNLGSTQLSPDKKKSMFLESHSHALLNLNLYVTHKMHKSLDSSHFFLFLLSI